MSKVQTISDIKKSIFKLKDELPNFPANEAILLRFLMKISKNIEKRLSDKMQTYGLTGSSWGVLMITYHSAEKRILPTELSEIMNLPKPTITRLIDELIDINYLFREHDKEDRRKVFISLTKEGLSFIYENIEEHNIFLTSLFNGSNTSLLVNELEKVIENMEKV